MKRFFIILILAVLLAAAPGGFAYADTGVGVEPGEIMPDFTVPLTDGTTATLSELTAEKDLVVLNIFATWCGPCEREFPDMEKVYRANRDRMEIVSVSGDPDETMEMIADYKAGHGLSFPMGQAGDALGFLNIYGYPTSILVDRNGRVGMVKVGAFVEEGEFEGKAAYFLSPEYDGKPLAPEQAASLSPYFYGLLLTGMLLLVIGRWGIFQKAGRKGWYSLIPFLNVYQEYAIAWNGWLGVLADLILPLRIIFNMIGLPGILNTILLILRLLISIRESIQLAGAFGKGKAFGIFMGFPVFREIGRLILGLGKASYRPVDRNVSAP